MRSLAARLWSDAGGQDLTEYALLLVLVALAAVAAVNSLGDELAEALTKVVGKLTT